MFNSPNKPTGASHRLVKFILIGLGGILSVLFVGFVAWRLLLVSLGTIMQFWFNYTQNTFMLWVLTLLSFLIFCGFIALLISRRSEYLKRERKQYDTSYLNAFDDKGYPSGSFEDSDDDWY